MTTALKTIAAVAIAIVFFGTLAYLSDHNSAPTCKVIDASTASVCLDKPYHKNGK